jgi:succinate dehydrogenase / fumarate reductase membrane anchor subunit
MNLQTPLGRFLGHGSAKDGTEHWWMQRVTAVALVPLTLWFVVAILTIDSLDYATVLMWLSEAFNSIMFILLLIAALYHSQLGLQVIVEDYVHTGWTKVTTLMLFKLAHIALGVAGIYSILSISTGAA